MRMPCDDNVLYGAASDVRRVSDLNREFRYNVNDDAALTQGVDEGTFTKDLVTGYSVTTLLARGL